jgi:hypothetical protein
MRNPSPSLVSIEQERTLIEACSLSMEQYLASLGSREKGPTSEEAEEKPRTVGRNEVSVKKTGALRCVFTHFAKTWFFRKFGVD